MRKTKQEINEPEQAITFLANRYKFLKYFVTEATKRYKSATEEKRAVYLQKIQVARKEMLQIEAMTNAISKV